MKNFLTKLAASSKTWFWSWIAASFVAPVVAIAVKYDLLAESTSTYVQVGVPSLMVAIFAIFRSWNVMREWAQEMPEGLWRELTLASMNIMPFLFLWVIGWLALNLSEDFFYIAKVLFITQAFGIFFRAKNRTIKRKKLIDRGYVNVLRN